MKKIKSFMLVMLLTAGSTVFADRSYADYKKDYEQIKKDIEIEYKKQAVIREDLRKNGTPFEKASIETTDLVLDVASVAIPVGVCSYIVNSIVGSFEVTTDMPYRGTVATVICASTLSALYASFEYEETQKSKSSWFK